MAEAGPSSAAMASAPLHHVAAAHQSELYAFLSANSVQLVDITSEAKPTTLAIPTTVFVPQPTLPDQSDAERYADQPHISFARLASFSHSDRFLALTGDDKVLRVWKLQRDADNRITGFEFGKEIVIKLLPKRAAVLHWMPPTDNTPAGSEELIVIDRFGDVRSIMVNENDVRTLPSTSPDADAKVDASADEQDQMDSPTDASMQILLGHVSMITSLAFIPAAKQGAPPAYIITGDRDEHIRISRWGPKRLAYVIDRFLQGSQAFVGALAVVANAEGTLRLVSSEGGQSLRVWTLPQPSEQPTGSAADTSSERACLSINDLGSALAPFVLARDREERKRESKAYQASSKRNKAAKRKQDQRGTDGSASEAAEAKPLAAQYAKDSKPTVVISDLLPFTDAEGTQWLLVVVEGAAAFFHIPVSALLEPVSSEDKKRDISSQIRVTRAAAPILHLALVQRAASADVSVIATFDTRPEFRGEAEAAVDASAEAAVFRLDAAGNFACESESPLIQALLPATEPSAGASDEAPRALLDASVVEHLGLYPALTTWPKIEVPSSAEIIATRSSRKGRFNHPLDTSLIGVAEVNETKPSTASSDPAADDAQRRKLVKTMQGGKRERGRERNREAIRLAQEQAQEQASQ
ncbi:WD repeat protein WDR4 [Moesziomyces antarcticus T-34]|uniref:WD repeat protein WDR4 n=1 Tax=Pseudozyma antarctica (strain T-34) TaxID=1151754 RepID=M9M6G2_PSEA3|nr:WD repeat protein WDR4 [Moesziomyces antarcticus T-34]